MDEDHVGSLAELRQRLTNGLRLRPAGFNSFVDDRTNITYIVEFLSPDPTPVEITIKYRVIRKQVIESRTKHD